MEKEKDYLDILKLSIGIIAFIIISNIVVNAYFCTSLKKIQSENLTHIEQIIKNIEIKDSKKNNFTLNFKNEDLSNINEKTYDDFLIQYNQNQSNWLNFWLTILSITFTFLALIVPICFMKLYQDKKNEIDQLIKETREQKESMQLNVDDVKNKSEKIVQDLEIVKCYANRAESFAKYSEATRLLSAENKKETQIEKAKQLIREAYQLNPDSVQISEAMAMNVLYKEKSYEEAMTIIKKILETEEDKKYYEDLSDLYEKIKKYDESIKYLEKAIDLSTDSNMVRYYKAQKAILYTKTNKFEKAKEIANDLYCNSNKFEIVRSYCALIYIYLKDFQKAIDIYKECYAINKNQNDLYNLIEACIFNGDFDAAVEYLQIFLQDSNNYIYEDDYVNWLNEINKKECNDLIKTLIALINNLSKKQRDD